MKNLHKIFKYLPKNLENAGAPENACYRSDGREKLVEYNGTGNNNSIRVYMTV